MKFAFAAALALCASATTLAAQDGNIRVGAGISTLGGGNFEAAYRLNDSWAVRGIISGGLNTTGTETVDGTALNYTAQLGGTALVGDYYVGGSGFRVTGGAVLFNTSFSGNVVASAANPVDVGLTTLNSGERVDVTVDFANNVAPMIGVGYDWNIGRSFTLSGEIGAIATGGTNVSVTSNLNNVPQADIDREIANIKGERDVNAYPYIGITASFRF